MFYYWADAELALAVAALVNDGVADMVAAHPARLRGLSHADHCNICCNTALRLLGEGKGSL